jgi:hypothetical protein
MSEHLPGTLQQRSRRGSNVRRLRIIAMLGFVVSFVVVLSLSAQMARAAGSTLNIEDISVNETNSGSYQLQVKVNASPAVPAGASVYYYTSDGTATAADNDYEPIAPGTTQAVCPNTGNDCATFWAYVTIDGDPYYEPNETFTVTIANPSNGATISDATATVTIMNDDPRPTLSIGDATKVEGDSGTTDFNFPVTMENVSRTGTVVNYSTADGTATAGSDYTAVSNGSITIPAGQTSGTITVAVNGDLDGEPYETFTVTITSSTLIDDGTATGTIQNDDDTTPPTVSDPEITGTTGDNGWYTSNVTVHWTVVDNDSPLINACPDTVITTDTASQEVTCTAESYGGTSAPKSVTIKRDATGPTGVIGTPNPTANADGWFNQPITITFSGTDATSGIAHCSSGSYNGPDTTGTAYPGSCTDNAGNTSPGSFMVKYDATEPTNVAGALARTPDHNGWYNKPVEITFSGQDATSGIKTCTDLQYSTPDGDNVTVEGSCTDYAGNSTGASISLDYDSTAPSNVAGTPARPADSNGWFNHPVGITFSGDDTTSGIDVCTSSSYDGPDNGSATVDGSCTDKAGNSTDGSFALKYDATAPTNVISTPERTPDSTGWYNHPVKITFSGDDATSTIENCDSPTYDGPDTSNAVITGTCTDYAGNETPATTNLSYDATSPVVIYSGNAGAYTIDQAINISCTATDNLSGLATNGCQNISGPATDFIVGANSYSATATDIAGNSGNTTVSFTVAVTAESLSNLTTQYASNSRLARRLNAPLGMVELAERMHNPRMKASAVNSYILLINTQRGRGLTGQEADTLIALVHAL